MRNNRQGALRLHQGPPPRHDLAQAAAAKMDRVAISGRQANLARRAALASVALAVLLALMKLAAAIATGSIAVLSSLVDSLADIVASAITLVSVQISQQPPDPKHRFGHGKAEALSALAQAALVLGSALFVFAEGLQRLVEPQPLRAPSIGLAVMGAAILLTFALLAYQRHVVAQTGSQAIAADSLHYRSDLLTNLAVVISLAVSAPLGWWWLDVGVGVVIALWLAVGAIRIARWAVDTLMDRELSDAERARIDAIVRAHPAVADVHDLRTRRSGVTVFIEMHIELDPEMTVRDAHQVCEAVERELRRVYPEAEIILHQEPAGIEDARLDDRIAAATTDAGRTGK